MQRNNRVTLVTGGSGRIGSAIVQTLCTQGHTVLLHYNTSEAAAQNLYEQWPNQIVLLHCDLLNEVQLSKMIGTIKQRFTSLTGLVNNAGIFIRNTVKDWDPNLAKQHWTLNCHVPQALSIALWPLLSANQGAIVNVVDQASHHRPWPHYADYAASKAALVALTRSLSVELAPSVRVNAVGLGLISEDGELNAVEEKIHQKIPMRRSGSPSEIAETVQFLLEGPQYITGQVVCVDGGWSVAP